MSTTLVTFLLQTPRGVNTVGLLGSWDNFSKLYPMKKDTSLGSNHWRGCHSFTDIICDGNSVESPDDKRDGALMQGGVYWYYLDNEVEYHDPKESSTTSCPLLPGQEVNILEVPFQVDQEPDSHHRRTDSSTSVIEFTLNPDDKYLTPKPPASPSKVKPESAICQDVTPTESLTAESTNPTDHTAAVGPIQTLLSRSPPSSSHSLQRDWTRFPGPNDRASVTAPPSRARSIRQVGSSKIRRWASSVSRLPSRKGTRTQAISSPVPPIPARDPGLNDIASTKLDHGVVADRSNGVHTPLSESPPVEGLKFPAVDNEARNTASKLPLPLEEDSSSTNSVPNENSHETALFQRLSCSSENYAREENVATDETDERANLNVVDKRIKVVKLEEKPQSSELLLHLTHHSDDERVGSLSHSTSQSSRYKDYQLAHTTSIASSRGTSGVFSTIFSSDTINTGQRTPLRLSQPLTPTFSNFGDFVLETEFASPQPDPAAKLDQLTSSDYDESYLGNGFRCYNQPEAETASALTIRNLKTAKSKESDDEGEPFHPRHRDEIIKAWSDATGQHRSAIDDLADEIGYLRGLIV